jgi:hypothetical protein
MNDTFLQYWTDHVTSQPQRTTFFASLLSDLITAFNAASTAYNRGITYTTQNFYFPFDTTTYNPTGLAPYLIDFKFRPNGQPGEAFKQYSNNFYSYYNDLYYSNFQYWRSTSWGAWAYDQVGQGSPISNQGNTQQGYDWCQAIHDWQPNSIVCPETDTCEWDGRMKADFVNFILNITNQNQLVLNPNSNQGFCAVDLEPLFDDSYADARKTWADAEFVQANIGNQKAFKITHLAEFVYTAEETANGGGNQGPTDHPVIITWTLTIDFTSIVDLQAFKTQLAADFASALGVPVTRIVIDLVASASTVNHVMAGTPKTSVLFHIVPTDKPEEPTAVSLGTLLTTQFGDKNSQVYKGTYTQFTDSTTAPRVIVDTTGAGSVFGPSYIIALFAVVLAFFFSN